MSFDPTKPAAGSPNSSAEMRAQLNGLKDLIDLAAAGGVTGAQVDGVNTTDPANPALAAVSLAGGVLHFIFTLPRGNDGGQGPPGIPGNNGSDGGPGAPGPQGPPFAQAVIDSVTTLPPGSAATVSVMFDGSNVRFTFGLPAGADGSPGAPGEVTNAGLASAIAGTSANSNTVSTLNLTASDPPSQSEVQAIAAKLDELILALRRGP